MFLIKLKGNNNLRGGEQVLLPGESCNLGSIDLSKFVVTHAHTEQNEEDKEMEVEEVSEFDYDSLKETITNSIRFLDNIISINHYVTEEIKEKTLATRKCGLGVMGWADALILMGIPYNSEEALHLAEEIMHFVNKTAHEASRALYKEKGAFPIINESIYASDPHRNATVTTIAPTGCGRGHNLVFTDDGLLSYNELKPKAFSEDTQWYTHDINIVSESSIENSTQFYYNGKPVSGW